MLIIERLAYVNLNIVFFFIQIFLLNHLISIQIKSAATDYLYDTIYTGMARTGPGQFVALDKILPGAPCLTLVNINLN